MSEYQITRVAGTVLCAALVAAVAGLPQGAVAQPATDLDCNKCVGTSDVGDDAVTGSKTDKEAVRPARLCEAAKPPGADFSIPKNSFDVPAEITIMGKIKMKLPGPGVVTLISSGYTLFLEDPSSVSCVISKGNELDGFPVAAENRNIPNARRMPVMVSRAIEKDSGGKTDYRLYCHTQHGRAHAFNITLIGIYAPNKC